MTVHQDEPTGDLLALGAPHPAEQGLTHKQREAATQRFGARCLVWGLSINATAVVTALIVSIVFELAIYNSAAGELFGLLTFLGIVSTGTILITLGAVERCQRPQRALARKALVETRQAGQRLDAVVELVGAVPGRLAALEQVIDKVPAYGEGVILGAQLRADALGPEIS